MKHPLLNIVTAFALAVPAGCATPTPADVYTGVWVLNTQISSGAARSQVLTISVAGNQETYRSEMDLPGGARQVTDYTAAYDGREYPSRTVITEPGRDKVQRDDTVILRKVDDHVRERHWKQQGRVTRILRREVSPDGQRLTSRMIHVEDQGNERFDGTLVFERARASAR